MPRVLLTTTSFQDTPGVHHEKLATAGYEIVRERGPLPELRMLELTGGGDAFLCGEDASTEADIAKSSPRLRVISKYGIGLDKIDVRTATAHMIPVLVTPGVNHTTGAEHTFLFLLALEKNMLFHCDSTRSGGWKRRTGRELLGKRIGIVGLGRIGKEVAIRARAFGMEPVGFNIYRDEAFAKQHGVARAATVDEIFATADCIIFHTNLTPETRDLVSTKSIAKMKKGGIILNCARGEIVNTADMAAALESGQVAGYCTDGLDQEPPPDDHPLLLQPNCIITTHVGSRTFESAQRLATCAVENLVLCLSDQPPLAQANKF